MALTDIPGSITPQWSLSDRLIKARDFAGLDQTELADLTGISRASISAWENGHREPRRPGLLAIAFATGVPLQWLAGDDEICEKCGEPRSRCFCASAQVSGPVDDDELPQRRRCDVGHIADHLDYGA